MKTLITSILVVFACTAFAQSEILNVLDDQLEAFNDGDIDRLCNNISEDFIWYSVTEDSMYIEAQGVKAFRKGMKSYYIQFKGVKSEIVAYTISGNRVSFTEKITFYDKNGEKTRSSIGVYQIDDGKITRAWYFN